MKLSTKRLAKLYNRLISNLSLNSYLTLTVKLVSLGKQK